MKIRPSYADHFSQDEILLARNYGNSALYGPGKIFENQGTY